jgi:hypothetical protein
MWWARLEVALLVLAVGHVVEGVRTDGGVRWVLVAVAALMALEIVRDVIDYARRPR